jgi:DNA-binding MarR family transcriptional regulator
MSTDAPTPTLGALLNELLETLDAEVQAVYRADGLDYRPRYTPVMRLLGQRGPSTIRDIARNSSLSHSAASQTVAQMLRVGLVASAPGADARERIIQLTDAGEALLPRLCQHWAATDAAVAQLGEEIGISLEGALAAALKALEARPFRERIAEVRGKP